jgi:hypothetical protein
MLLDRFRTSVMHGADPDPPESSAAALPEEDSYDGIKRLRTPTSPHTL